MSLTSDFAHDVERMWGLADGWREPTVVYICNPNNPTGTITPSAEIDDWISSASDNVFFIVDEAYFPFVDDATYWSRGPSPSSTEWPGSESATASAMPRPPAD